MSSSHENVGGDQGVLRRGLETLSTIQVKINRAVQARIIQLGRELTREEHEEVLDDVDPDRIAH